MLGVWLLIPIESPDDRGELIRLLDGAAFWNVQPHTLIEAAPNAE